MSPFKVIAEITATPLAPVWCNISLLEGMIPPITTIGKFEYRILASFKNVMSDDCFDDVSKIGTIPVALSSPCRFIREVRVFSIKFYKANKKKRHPN